MSVPQTMTMTVQQMSAKARNDSTISTSRLTAWMQLLGNSTQRTSATEGVSMLAHEAFAKARAAGSYIQQQRVLAHLGHQGYEGLLQQGLALMLLCIQAESEALVETHQAQNALHCCKPADIPQPNAELCMHEPAQQMQCQQHTLQESHVKLLNTFAHTLCACTGCSAALRAMLQAGRLLVHAILLGVQTLCLAPTVNIHSTFGHLAKNPFWHQS